MNQLYKILEFNRQFVEKKAYEPFATTKLPDKKMVIFSCMDTRLIELLPHSMNLRNGDVKMIKNAGAIITHPFGSIMRSLLVAVYRLQAEEIYVISHHDCGMAQINGKELIADMIARGIDASVVDTLSHAGIHLENWLTGFESVVDNVKNSVNMIKNHPLMLRGVPVHGLVIDPVTGRLDLVIDGYKEL